MVMGFALLALGYPADSVTVIIIDFVIAEFVAFYANSHIVRPWKEIRDLLDLSKEKNIYTMGV